jgi:iron complex transport system ATP-binding protein
VQFAEETGQSIGSKPGRHPGRSYNPPVIEVSSVSHDAGNRRLFADFNWRLPDPGVYVLLGPTASGKSLISQLLAGRLRPRRGQVLIDGEPLYSMLGATAEPPFLAEAEVACREAEPLDFYLAAELANVRGSVKLLDRVWPELEAEIPGGRHTALDRLSHGQVLLAQVALACLIPTRLAVLDGHLTYLDHHYCAVAARMLASANQAQEKFVLLTASRLASAFPEVRNRYTLSGEFPLRLTELPAGSTVDTAVAQVKPGGALRVYTASLPTSSGGVTSGRHFTVTAHLEDGVRIRLVDGLDGALRELREQGVVVQALRWEENG